MLVAKKSKQAKGKPKQPMPKPQPKKKANRVVPGLRPQFSGLVNLLGRAICLPGSCPNLRLKPTAGDSHPTAAVSLHLATNVKQPTLAGTYTSVPQGNSFVAVFRDPFRAMIQFVTNSAGATYSYTAYFRPPITGGIVGTYSTLAGEGSYVDDLEPIYWQGTSTFLPHGKYLYPGIADDRSAVWLDYNATIAVTQSSSDTNAHLVVSVYDGGFEEVQSITFAASSATYTQTIATGGYMQLRYLTSTTTANTLTVTLTGTGDVFAHFAVPNAINHLPQLVRNRVNAVGVLLSPSASLLNVSGTIFGGDIEGNNMWYNFVTSTSISNLPPTNYEDFKFAVGMYAWLKPGDINELTMKNSVVYDGSFATRAAFNLTDPSRYLVFSLTSDVTGTTAPGLEFLMTVNWDLEYQTSDQWFETHLPTGTFFDTEMALEAICKIKVFHENPLHMSDIVNGLKGGYNLFRRHAPKFGKIMSILSPGFPGAFGAVGNAIGALPEW